MMERKVASPENRALKRLSTLSWKAEPEDDFIVMNGSFTVAAAEALRADLSREARDALGLSLIANKTRIMMRKSQAVMIFAMEHLPLTIQTAERGR